MQDSGRRNHTRLKTRLKVRFKDANAFISEYTHNISKGGLFMRTPKPVAQGTMVEVVLIMPETEKEISGVGEVIHVVTPDKATANQPAGMGIELKDISSEDQKLIEDFIRARLQEKKEKDELGRREHERYEARLRVRFGSLEALMEEYTHNISHGGIFIRTVAPKKLHERLKIILAHPLSGEEMILDGEVVRVVAQQEAQRTGQTPGMGVKFLNRDQYTLDQLGAFISTNSKHWKKTASAEET